MARIFGGVYWLENKSPSVSRGVGIGGHKTRVLSSVVTLIIISWLSCRQTALLLKPKTPLLRTYSLGFAKIGYETCEIA